MDEAEPPEQHMFGEEVIWLFVLGDMCIFALFFIYYVHVRAGDLGVMRAGQHALDADDGFINTLILLASSWLVILASNALKQAKAVLGARLLLGASALGLVFVAIKVSEYVRLGAAGLGLNSSSFFIFYYLLTGLHLAHLVTAIGVMLFFAYGFRRTVRDQVQMAAFESGAIFWHMVDLIWIIIFPLLYLLK